MEAVSKYVVLARLRERGAMFEDALVESAGRLKTQSKYWLFGAFALNGGLLAILTLMPLLYPEALPKTAMTATLIAPPPPPAPAVQVVHATPAVQRAQTHIALNVPRIIPNQIVERAEPPSPSASLSPMGSDTPDEGIANNGVLNSILGTSPPLVVTKPKLAKPLTVSSGVEAGNLLVKTLPVYPAIAQTAHITGTVVLRAIISKTGTIENLSVESGPVMLRQAALDGVKRWRYRPFLLNGEPTDVDTTITVNFAAS
jgi:periplasmic protein TonB